MDHTIQSPTVQKALPDLASLQSTLGFDSFLASPPPTITSDFKAVRDHIRGYAVQLERHERFTELWKHQYNNQLVTLRQLITTLDTRCEELRQQTLHGYSAPSDLEQRLLGLPEFEDLYYFLACKTRSLYADLQLRFSSNFITMSDVLHQRGSSTYAQAPCTVRDIRNFLRAVWFHLLHPLIIRAIEDAINHRKYQTLKANPLLPTWNMDDITMEDRERIAHFERGLNLDASTVGCMFEHLEDVSALSPPALLMKVSQKGLGFHFAPSVQSVPSQIHDAKNKPLQEQAWAHLACENDEYEHTQIAQDETDPVPHYVRELHRGFRSPTPASPRQPHFQAASPEPMADIQHHILNPSSAFTQAKKAQPKVQTVGASQPDVAVNGHQDRLSSVADSAMETKRFPAQTPLTSRKSGHLVVSSLSNYRMPFHGLNEFPHELPYPSLQSTPTEHTARLQQLEFEIGQRMQIDSARLQGALEQVEELKRENSQLQERLSMTSPAKGLFRRLSKGGDRTKRKSPRRSLMHGVTK